MNASEIVELIFRVFGFGLGAAAIIGMVFYGAQFVIDGMQLRRGKKKRKNDKNE